MVTAIALGGGGVAYGLFNLAVQLTALSLLARNRNAFVDFWLHSQLWLRLLVACTLALPALQLIPLPPAVWANFPGRELAVDARSALGPLGWHPLSLDSGRTLVALLGLIVPFTVLIIGLSAHARALVLTGWAIVTMGLVNFALGVPQILDPDHAWLIYPENPMSGVLFGTFANRNSTGLFLVLCLTLLVHLPASGRMTHNLLFRVIVAVLLLLAIVLTQSRSAIALSALPIASIALRHRPWVCQKLTGNRKGIAAVIGALAIALVTVFAAAPATRLSDGLDRFRHGNEARAFIWEDAAFSAHKYAPVGSGLGTFDEVFQADESLENLSSKTAGRAHNDYLEIAIEAGLPGIGLIAGWWLLIGGTIVLNRRRLPAWSAWSGGVIVAAIACQSVVDYPLRNQAILAVVAFALVALFHRGSVTKELALEGKA